MKKISIKNRNYIIVILLWALLGIGFIIEGGPVLLAVKEAKFSVQYMCIVSGISMEITGLLIIIESVWYMYHALQVVSIDEIGVTCKILWKTLKYMKWNEIQEWGIGQQYSKPNIIGKCYRSHPVGDERILQERDKNKGKKFIYFSAKTLLKEEKEQIYAEQLQRADLLTIEYSERIYLNIFNLKKKDYCLQNRENNEEWLLKDKNIKQEDTKEQMVCYVDIFRGILIVWFIAIVGSSGLWVILDEITSWNVAILAVLYDICIIWYAYRYLKRIKINEKGIRYRDVFFRERFWDWDSIYECAVLRDYFEEKGSSYYKEAKYIYFTKKPFIYKKEEGYPFFPQDFKMRDIVMVRYSEKLYWYLKKLGVLGIKDNNIETKS